MFSVYTQFSGCHILPRKSIRCTIIPSSTDMDTKAEREKVTLFPCRGVRIWNQIFCLLAPSSGHAHHCLMGASEFSSNNCQAEWLPTVYKSTAICLPLWPVILAWVCPARKLEQERALCISEQEENIPPVLQVGCVRFSLKTIIRKGVYTSHINTDGPATETVVDFDRQDRELH